jgi:hypothetical protein
MAFPFLPVIVVFFAILFIPLALGQDILTLDDFWNGNAHFEFISKAVFPTADVPGSIK